jgi:hypothetical protein
MFSESISWRYILLFLYEVRFRIKLLMQFLFYTWTQHVLPMSLPYARNLQWVVTAAASCMCCLSFESGSGDELLQSIFFMVFPRPSRYSCDSIFDWPPNSSFSTIPSFDATVACSLCQQLVIKAPKINQAINHFNRPDDVRVKFGILLLLFHSFCPF